MGNKQRLKTADGNEALFSKQPTVKRNGKYSTRKTRETRKGGGRGGGGGEVS